MENIGILFVAVILGWFWLDSTQTRELAIGICRTACEQHQVQLLDHTVALRHLKLRWPRQGLRLRRVYRFEFSEEGVSRRTGYLVMLGQELQEISLGLPEQPSDS